MVINKIIFLDIDGVLNSNNTFFSSDKWRKFIGRMCKDSINGVLNYYMADIDLDKLFMLRDACNLTGAKIVISSSWRNLSFYPLVEERMVCLGLPIIGITPYFDNNRGGRN